MNSIRRSCHSALFNYKPPFTTSNGSRRAFSQCRACSRGSLPQFLEPSTPELSTLLAQLNSKILLPAHLNHDQRLLVYKKKYQPRLEAEPIHITLGDVTLPLEHLDRNRDTPSRWQTFKNVIEKSSTPEDWENVLRMVEGFHNTNIGMPRAWKEKVVRKLSQAGMHHLILKAVQRADSTGFSLKDPVITFRILRNMHTKASAGWDKEETKKALSAVEQIVELMENKDHLGGIDILPRDLRADPRVIAAPLELTAARAKRHTEGLDRDGKVAKYAARLMTALQQDDWAQTTLVEQLDALGRQGNVYEIKDTMWRLIPLWNALKTAKTVLGADMPMVKDAQRVASQIREGLAIGVQSIAQVSAKTTKPLNEDIKACEEL